VRSPRSIALLLVCAAAILGLLAARVVAQDSRGPATCSDGVPYAEVQIDPSPRLAIEVARTPAEHEHGLMDRSWMPPDSGMVFVYTSPVREGYWMRDTLIPLSIAWLDQNGTILDIQDMDALDDQHVHYPGLGTLPIAQLPRFADVLPYAYALETNVGWFVDHGVGVGQQVLFCLGT
jgi:uncharacterized membrane protein (UPF0127 family)